jgi:hypothetical protein
MSVANQANEKLSQLVTLTARIEALLAGDKKDKDKGGAKPGTTANTTVGSSKNDDKIQKDAAVVSGLSSSMTELIKVSSKISPTAGNNLSGFLKNLVKSLSEATDKLDPAKMKSLMETLKIISEGSIGFMKGMAASALLGIPAMLGAVFFGTTVKILMAILKNVKGFSKEAGESIETLMKMGKAAVGFGLAMALWAIVGIPALIGGTLFATTVFVMLKVLQKVGGDGKALDSLGNLLKIAAGAALFALVVVGISKVADDFLKGVLVFTLGVGAMLLVFNLVTLGGTAKGGPKDLLSLGIGAAAFALTMVGIGLVAEPFAIGVLVFTLGVSAMLLAFNLVTLGGIAKGGPKDLLNLAMGAGLFALVMVGISFVAEPFALGVLVFTLAVGAMMLTFNLVNLFFSKNKDPLRPLYKFAIGAAVFALTMIGISYFAVEFALGTLVFTLAVGAMMLVFGLLGKMSQQINSGITALQRLTKPAFLFALMLVGVGYFAKEAALGALALSVGIIAVGGATFLLGKMNSKGDVTRGGIVLGELVLPMLGFSAALFVLAAAPGSPTDLFLKIGAVAASIVVLGLAAYALGLPAVYPFAILGAGALVVLGAALLVFSAALFVLSKVEFKEGQAEVIGDAIWTIGKSIAKLGLISIPALLGAAVLLPISVALVPLTGSLALFKKIGWTEDDAKSLKSAVSSTVKAFSEALSGVGIIGMIKLLAAIPIIAMIGTALVSLAAGVKAMATLSFTEMEYDEKEKRLVPKRVVKLTNDEIQAVGPNVASILNALAEPLTMFGVWATSGTAGIGPFRFGQSYMERGIETAGKIGSVIGSIAEGVQKMANLEVIEYQIVGKGTKDAALVPKGSRKLGPTDFTNAATNTATILGALAEPLVQFGLWADSGQEKFQVGGFSIDIGKSYMEKGIDMASKIGGILVNLAEGVVKMASGEVVSSRIVGAGTKDAKLVPDKIRSIGPDDYKNAAKNVGEILTALINPLTDFGKAMESGEEWFGFSAGNIEKGIEWSAKAIDPVVKIADLVLKMAGGQAVLQEVVSDGKGGKKLVPGKIINFADSIDGAKENVKKLLESFTDALVEWSAKITANEASLSTAVDFMPDLISTVGKIADASDKNLKMAKNYSEANDIESKGGFLIKDKFSEFLSTIVNVDTTMKGIDMSSLTSLSTGSDSFVRVSNNYLKITKNFAEAKALGVEPNGVLKGFAGNMFSIGESMQRMGPGGITTYFHFTNITEKLTKIISPFEKFVKLFGQFTKDMGSFVGVWKTFGKDNADNLKSYSESLKTISSVDPGKLQAITNSIREQAVAQAQLNATQKTVNQGTSQTVTQTPTGGKTPAANPASQPVSQQQVVGMINQALPKILSNLTVTNLTVTGKFQS